VVIASTLTIPVAAFAQNANNPITRADVLAQLVQAEKQGTLHQSKVHYPQYLKVQNTRGTQGSEASAYGYLAYGSTQAGPAMQIGHTRCCIRITN